MLKSLDKIFLLGFGFIVLLVTSIIMLTRWVPAYGGLLRTTTIESGLFEWASVLALILLSLFCLYLLVRNHKFKVFGRVQFLFFLLLSFASMFAAMEELSWGQHVFKFSSGEFFQKHNLQRETNLHNLIPAMLFSTTINIVVYVFFIFLPLLRFSGFRVAVVSQWLEKVPTVYWPSSFVVLVMVYSCTLHHYFSPITWSDSAALAMSLVLALICWRRNCDNKVATEEVDSQMMPTDEIKLFGFMAWGLVAITLLYASCYKIYSQYNLQYEIREFIVVYGFFYWAAQWGLGLFSNPRDG